MNIYNQRRQRLAEAMVENSCAIVFSGKEIARSEDECYDFYVNRNFFYLTGLERADMALVVYKTKDRVIEYLFALPYSAFAAKWFGGRMPFEEITEVSGVQMVREMEELDSTIASIYNRNRQNSDFSFYFDMWRYSENQDASVAVAYSLKLRNLYPAIKLCDIYPILTKMRLVKDEYEIDCIKKAIGITKVAYESMMRYIKPGMNELMMEAVFDYALKSMMCNQVAFSTICASGKNATVLHYRENNQVMQDGTLFLCDCGATKNNYCADITRTFPVNGKFTDRQKEIYNIVLAVQKLVEENAKPGLTIRQLNQIVIDFYKEELPKHGLNKDVSEYYMHSISHHLGLDTHDVDAGLPLEAGNVITNEPGLYIEDEEIGIRIENDLLITEDGCINLASDLIREADEIENFIANR